MQGGQITERTDHRADRFQGRPIRRWKYEFVDIAVKTTIGREAVTNDQTDNRADKSLGRQITGREDFRADRLEC